MKEIMNELIDNGYEAYIVGGYVRDYLLGISSNDIDICTNASIDEIMKIFKGRGKAFKEYFSYHIEENGYTYDITSFRKELAYKKNKPTKLIKINDLESDLLRRDFTINTFAIDKDDKLIDLLGAKKDLDSKIIRVVGNTEKKLSEDKTRIVRAIRLACSLDFDFDTDIIRFLSNKNVRLLNEVSKEYKKSELDKIFKGPNPLRFFYILKKYNISKFFDISFDNVVDTYDEMGIWAQVDTNLPLTRKEKKIIDEIKSIVTQGDIQLGDLNKYSEDVIYNAAGILGLEEKVRILYDILNMNSFIEMDASVNTILRYTDIYDFKRVYKLIERNIMEGNLNNNSEDIIRFLKDL